MTFTKYTAKVSGVIWLGCKASTQYDFPSLPTRADVLAKAGDFQHVTKIQVTATQTTITRVRLAA